nr:hypothetical protein CFP56_68928 [Quercus suber]
MCDWKPSLQQQGNVATSQDCSWMWCCWIKGNNVMLKLVRIATGRCATLIMIEFVEVNAFGADFILVDVTVVGPFRNILSKTFDATAGEDTALDLVELKH